MTTNLNSRQIDEIRRRVQQGLAEIERGESSDFEGQEGLRRFFDEVRSEAYKKLLDKRRKKLKTLVQKILRSRSRLPIDTLHL